MYSRRWSRQTRPRPGVAQYRAQTAPSTALPRSSSAIAATVSGSSTVSASIVSTRSAPRAVSRQPWLSAPAFLSGLCAISTTVTGYRRAISAVRSVQLLATTTTSAMCSHSGTSCASRPSTVAAMPASSLWAGTRTLTVVTAVAGAVARRVLRPVRGEGDAAVAFGAVAGVGAGAGVGAMVVRSVTVGVSWSEERRAGRVRTPTGPVTGSAGPELRGDVAPAGPIRTAWLLATSPHSRHRVPTSVVAAHPIGGRPVRDTVHRPNFVTPS